MATTWVGSEVNMHYGLPYGVEMLLHAFACGEEVEKLLFLRSECHGTGCGSRTQPIFPAPGPPFYFDSSVTVVLQGYSFRCLNVLVASWLKF